MKKNNKGLTLVEIIVALAILGIIAVTFITVFAGMFNGIAKGGNRGKATFSAQKDAEVAMTDLNKGSPYDMEIKYNGSVIASVPGKSKSGTGTGGSGAVKEDVEIHVFVAN